MVTNCISFFHSFTNYVGHFTIGPQRFRRRIRVYVDPIDIVILVMVIPANIEFGRSCDCDIESSEIHNKFTRRLKTIWIFELHNPADGECPPSPSIRKELEKCFE